MTSDELRDKTEAHIESSTIKGHQSLDSPGGELLVIKYLPARHLGDALAHEHLYASERAGFTWGDAIGDAIYVAPVRCPRTTMMFGDVGLVGTFSLAGARLFDASDPTGIALYQEWITWQRAEYTELTTTVHAHLANRALRNRFRTRFRIDCVFFRPDEECTGYVDSPNDWWLAVTHWDASGRVGSGFSQVIKNLRCCVIGPDVFSERDDARGFEARLYALLLASHGFVPGHYSSLEADIRAAYASHRPLVVVSDFH